MPAPVIHTTFTLSIAVTTVAQETFDHSTMPKIKQPSRKTKATWRKNIDLSGVEARLENERAAERVGLAPVNEATASASFFVEDRKGDERVAKSYAGKRPLKSLAVLNKDLGAAPVQGRARKGVDATLKKSAVDGQGGLTPEQRAHRSGMSRRDIEKLRRAAGRDVKGAFGVIVEEQDGAPERRGPEAVFDEAYDVWTTSTGAEVQAEGVTQTKKVRPPRTLSEKRTEDVALPLPHQGQSYNPAAEAHEALLQQALLAVQSEEEKRQIELEFKRKWDEGAKSARATAGLNDVEQIVGMRIGAGDADVEDDEEEKDAEEAELVVKKPTKRKTKQQRAKAKRLKDEIRAREAVKASKRTKAQLQQLRSLKKQLLDIDEEQAAAAEQRRTARQLRLAEKVGMYKLPKREEEVQLGEDLSESLRGLKPEGNLLRDRVHAFQKRGLIEPKQGTAYSKVKGASRRLREYETHAYKRFV